MWKLKSIIFTVFICLLMASSINVYAENFRKNISDEEFEEMYSLKIVGENSDLKEPFTWMSDFRSFILIEETDDGDYYWWNAPNLQKTLRNYGTNIFPGGYMGTPIDPYEENEKKKFKLTEISPKDQATNGIERFGYHIPSMTYIGEYPRVELSIMGVIIDDNPITGLITKIKGLFGGNIINPPSPEDFKTLRYISPVDYITPENSFEKWLDLYWNNIVSRMDDGQILCQPGNGIDSEGIDNEGNQWVWKTIVVDNDINYEDDPKEINKLLKEVCGKRYQEVVKNIILVSIQNGWAKEFDNKTVRIMPYEKDSLLDVDKRYLVKDPRVPSTVGGVIEFGIEQMVSGFLKDIFVKLNGSLMEFAGYINGLMSFEVLEDNNIDILFLFKNHTMMGILMSILLIIGVFIFLKGIINYFKGRESVNKIAGKFLISFLSFLIMFYATYSNNSFMNNIKFLFNFSMNLSNAMVVNSPEAEFYKSGDIEKDKNLLYWLLYFDHWSLYHTGTNLRDKKNKISDYDYTNSPELKEFEKVKINGNNLDHWPGILADSFTSGKILKRNAYRAIDHYYAPIIDENPIPGTVVSTSENPLSKGKEIQSQLGLEKFIMGMLILLAVIAKFVLFAEMIYSIIILPYNLAGTYGNKFQLTSQLKDLGVTIVRVPLFDIFIYLIANIAFFANSAVSFVMIALIIGIYVAVIRTCLKYWSQPWVPKIFKIGKRRGLRY